LLQKGNSSKNTILKLGPDVPKDVVIQVNNYLFNFLPSRCNSSFDSYVIKHMFQMVLQNMSMRRETLNNHQIVAEEIERRVRMLSNAKERQFLEMQRLEDVRQKLQDDVENKAEKLDEINNKQEELTKR
jgi:hypothetical protein